MTGRSLRIPRFPVALALTVLAGMGVTSAQTDPLPSPYVLTGVPAGPFYLLPFVGVGVSVETNPFYQPRPQHDVVTRLNPRLGVVLPFSHSYFRVAYDGVFRRYAQTEVTNPDSHHVLAELSLLFNTADRLVLLADKTSGASEVLQFDGGETTYDGTPFRYAVYTAGAERNVPGHLGYQVAAAWSRLNFDQTDVNFFEFGGYDITADINAPVSSSLWIVAGAAVRRYDHHRTTDPPGVIYRQEHANALRVGVQGLLGGGGSYRAVIAYDRADYPGGAGTGFEGLVAEVLVDWALGPMTTVSMSAGRRPWSSFYGDNNYYLAGTLGTSARHTWAGGSEVGASLALGRSAYPDPVSIAVGGELRKDRALQGDLYAIFAFQRQCGIRLSYDAQLRRSNVDGVEYTAQSVGVQLVLGWR